MNLLYKINLFMHKECTSFFEWKVCELECVCTVDYKHLPEIANCLNRLIRSPAEVICKCIALKLTQIIQTLQNQRAWKHNVTFFPFLLFLLCLSFCFSVEYQSLVLYQFFIVLFLYLFCPIRVYIYWFFLIWKRALAQSNAIGTTCDCVIIIEPILCGRGGDEPDS